MADQVQAALDQMVAPLKDLLDRGIFSEVSPFEPLHDVNTNHSKRVSPLHYIIGGGSFYRFSTKRV
jgi:hypothetical protein